MYALGDTVYVSGVAVDTASVNLSVVLDGGDEVLSTSAPVGDFGYWEANLEIPADAPVGVMTLNVTIPEDEEAFYSLGFEVR